MRAVVNATPLIALGITDHLEILAQLFNEVYVPQSVYGEVVLQGNTRPGSVAVQQAEWLTVQAPSLISPIPLSLMGLDMGEQDVILLGQELAADWLIIDERLGRRIAQAMGFRVKGTLGLLLIAYETGLLSKDDVSQAVSQLKASSVRLSPKLFQWFSLQLGKI
jgi:predicted nucleic acid-binding protein